MTHTARKRTVLGMTKHMSIYVSVSHFATHFAVMFFCFCFSLRPNYTTCVFTCRYYVFRLMFVQGI